MKAFGNIDHLRDAEFPDVDFLEGARPGPDGAIERQIEFGRNLRFTGWLVTPERTPFKAATLIVGDRSYPCIYGTLRPDIAATFANVGLANTGFSVTVEMAELLPGRYTCSIHGETESGTTHAIDSKVVIHLAEEAARPELHRYTPSQETRIEIKAVRPGRYVARDSLLRIDGWFRNAGKNRQIYALHADGFVHGSFPGAGELMNGDPERFTISLPAREILDSQARITVAGLDDTGSATVALDPIALVAPLPRAISLLPTIRSSATAQARYTAHRDENGRIDRDTINLAGYAYDRVSGRPGSAIAVQIRSRDLRYDPVRTIWGAYGLPNHLAGIEIPPGTPDDCAFEIRIDRAALPMGTYTVSLCLAGPRLRAFYKPIELPTLTVHADIAADGSRILELREKQKAAGKS